MIRTMISILKDDLYTVDIFHKIGRHLSRNFFLSVSGYYLGKYYPRETADHTIKT